MRFSKKMVLLCVFMALIFMVSACGGDDLADKAAKKAAEKIAEKAIENESGEKVDIDLDEEGATIKSESGSAQFGDSVEWPKEYMADIPVPKAKIIGVMSDSTSKACTVTFEEMSKGDADKYLKALEDMGFTEESMKTQTTDGEMLIAKRSDGSSISFIFNISSDGNGGGSISYQPKPAE